MNDDKIAQLIAGMRVAAREDWDLNENKKPAVKNCNVEPDHVPTEQGGPADGPRGGKCDNVRDDGLFGSHA